MKSENIDHGGGGIIYFMEFWRGIGGKFFGGDQIAPSINSKKNINCAKELPQKIVRGVGKTKNALPHTEKETHHTEKMAPRGEKRLPT